MNQVGSLNSIAVRDPDQSVKSGLLVRQEYLDITSLVIFLLIKNKIK
jgi:hypothetical protein